MGEVKDDLTSQIFAETGKGDFADKAELSRLYKVRDEIARAEHPSAEEPPPEAIADQGPSYSDIEDEILGFGEAGELVLEHLGGDETRLRRGLALIEGTPALATQYQAAWNDPQLRADMILIAEKAAREAGIAPMELNEKPRAPSPSPTNVMAWQGRVNEMGSAPPSERDAAYWLEWRLLHERIHGQGPIVGMAGRTV